MPTLRPSPKPTVDPEQVINNILKKYGWDKVPEAKELEAKRSEILSSALEKERTHRRDHSYDLSTREGLRSPNVNFLSPLVSSAKDTRNNTLSQSQIVGEDPNVAGFTTPDRKFDKPLQLKPQQISEIKEESKDLLDTQ